MWFRKSTLGKSRLGSYVKHSTIHGIGHILAQNSKDTGIVVPDHPFLSYAKEFWLLHTRYTIEPSTQRLWFNLIGEVDLSNLRTHPLVAAAWADVEVPQEPAAFAGLFWSVQNSHIPIFDHAINLGKHASSFTSQFRRIVALRRMFKSLSSLSSLSPSSGDNPPVSPRPIIEAHMISHLLPISVLLNTFEFTKWMESHIEPAKCSKTPTRNTSALSAHDNSTIELSPGSIESPGPYELDATMTQIAVLEGFPVTLDVPRTFKLLPKYPIHQFVDFPSSISQAFLYTLQSNVPHEMFLRKFTSHLNSGLDLKSLSNVRVYSILKVLVESRELNSLLVFQLRERLVNSIRIEDGMRNQIFRRACLMGNFDIAVQTRPRPEAEGLRPPYRGDEINLVLQNVSEERFKLATWLVNDGASYPSNDIDASGCYCSTLRRAMLLRNWHLASALLEHGASTMGLARFCSRIELTHFCVLHNDLDGIAFLAKATKGKALNTPSAGSVFNSFTPIQLAAFRDSDWCRLHSIRALMAEGARLWSMTTDSYMLSIEEKLERLVISTAENSARDAGEYLHSLRGIYAQNKKVLKVSSKIVCLVAILVGKFVSKYRQALSQPQPSNEEVLGYFSDSVVLMSIFLKSPRAPGFHKTDLILSLREITGALSRLDTVSDPSSLEGPFKSTPITWKVQMRLLQVVDLILKSTISAQSEQQPRKSHVIPEILCADLLHTSIASKPTALDGDSLASTSQFALQFKYFRNILEDGFNANGLTWLLQCLLILGKKFSGESLIHFATDLDLTYMSNSWLDRDESPHPIPVSIRERLRCFGCRKDTLDMLDEVLISFKLMYRAPLNGPLIR
ncbi:uncharacterized protein CLUP02_04893 [Colletotrichum lupini]|uniref:Uncharacterized protein n=1 Tax=Colletotrichum lupini TaxID=145971 RepID=A0A9Q8SLP3_9PEZI|nr:uncharacterized protein CLUP02_04893 [Colletotrichum lupini]UQC79413.1 hypothetical protein CLUP02_04893 [Colletotrichum lupini]